MQAGHNTAPRCRTEHIQSICYMTKVTKIKSAQLQVESHVAILPFQIILQRFVTMVAESDACSIMQSMTDRLTIKLGPTQNRKE